MLAQAIPPIDQLRATLHIQAAEKWALTHLAYYNDAPFTTRSVLSFQRSYGMDDILRFNRVSGGRPGCVVARWTNQPIQRYVIAIEGTTSWGQIFNLNSATMRQPTGFNYAQVLSTFDDYAVSLMVTLTSTLVPLLTSTTQKQFAFCGHSLGAAVAEIMVERYARANPQHSFELYKFGSPRVGNRLWEANKTALSRRVSFLCGNDPIFIIPQGGTVRTTTPAVVPSLALGFAELDRSYMGLDPLDGTGTHPNLDFTPAQGLDFLRWLNSDVTPTNPWFDHNKNQYRLCFTEALSTYQGFESKRFRHVEMPDENTWGANWVTRGGVTSGMLNLLDPAPADVQTGYVAPVITGHGTTAPAVLPQPQTGRGVENVFRGQYTPSRQHRGHTPSGIGRPGGF